MKFVPTPIRAIIVSGILAVLSFYPPASRATLIDDTVTCDFSGLSASFVCSAASASVGAGLEFTLDSGLPRFEVDIGAASIQITAVTGSTGAASERILTLGDLDWVGMDGRIVSIENFSQSATPLTASAITFSDHEVQVSIFPGTWSLGGVARWDLVTEHAVPEPVTLALVGLGLAGFGFNRCRMRNARRWCSSRLS